MATSADYERKIDIGSVLSRGFAVLGANFVPFLGLSLLLGGLPTFAFSWLAAGNLNEQNFLSASGGGLALVAFVVQLAASALLQAVIMRSSLLTLSGRDADIGGRVASAFGLILPLIGLSILSGLVVLIGLILLIVPGIIAYAALSVAVPALVEERRSVTESMERSADLTKGSRWRIVLLLLILVIAYFAAAAVAGGAIAAIEGGAAQAIAEAALATLSTLVMSAMVAALYVELRTVKEGATTEGLAAIFE